MDSENNPRDVIIDAEFTEADTEPSQPNDNTQGHNPTSTTEQEETTSNDAPPIQEGPADYLRNQSGSERKPDIAKYYKGTEDKEPTTMRSTEDGIFHVDSRPIEEQIRDRVGNSNENFKFKTLKEPQSPHREIWKIPKGETPVSIVEKYAPEMRERILKDKEDDRSRYARDKDGNIDPADLLGARQNEQSVRGQAEIILINNHIKEYAKALESGRKLTKEEVEKLKTERLTKLPAYKQAYNEYKSKGLQENEISLLLQNKFAKELSTFENNLKDKDGKYSSTKCPKQAIEYLSTSLKKDIVKDYMVYKKYRQELNDRGRDQEATEQEKIAFKSRYGFELTPVTGKLVQMIEEQNRNQMKMMEDIKIMQDREREKERLEQEARIRERKLKKASIIAGVVGFWTAVTVGTPAVLGGVAVMGISALTSFVGGKRINSLTEQIGKAESTEEKERLEKKLALWGKIKKITDTTLRVAKGFTTGAGIGLAFTNLFMGGESLIQKIAAAKVEAITPPSTELPDPLVHREVIPDETTIVQGNAATIPPTDPISTEVFSTDGVLIRDGRVDLPGSAWHGNLATNPIGADSLSSASYTGGATNMGAWNLEQALISNGLNRSTLTSLPTSQFHSLLNAFQANPSLDLTTALNNIGSVEARNLVQIITGN